LSIRAHQNDVDKQSRWDIDEIFTYEYPVNLDEEEKK
jgi:hypothetical protein